MPTQRTVRQQWRGMVAIVCEDNRGKKRFDGRARLGDAKAYFQSGPVGDAKWWAEMRDGRLRQFVWNLDDDDDNDDDDDDGPEVEAAAPLPTPEERWLQSVERMAALNQKAYSDAFSKISEAFQGVLEAYNDALGALAERAATLEAKLQNDALEGHVGGGGGKDDDTDSALAGLAKTVANAAGQGIAEKVNNMLQGKDDK